MSRLPRDRGTYVSGQSSDLSMLVGKRSAVINTYNCVQIKNTLKIGVKTVFEPIPTE